MPFRSQAQWRYMYSQHPEIARRWARETPRGYASLPRRVSGYGVSGYG